MYSPSERVGMFFAIMGACFSLVSVSLVLLLAVTRWLRRTIFSGGRNQRSQDATDNIIFLNLMVSDLILALGYLPSIMWMSIGVIKEGPFCTTQAVVKQIGADGVALSSLAIAVYTFCVLVLRWNVTRYISKLVVVVIWIFIALVIVIPYIPYRKKKIYGNVGYWCWVKPEFMVLQLVTEYIWLWVSLGLMTILYIIMFTMMRGWFIVDNGVWYWYRNYRPRYNADQPVEEQEEKESKVIANMLLSYPVVYCICIVFYSIARWRFFVGSTVPHQFTLFTSTLFSLSGTFNAVLFFLTRPDLVVGHDNPSPPIPAISTQRQSFHDREQTSISSENFGCLPTPAAVDYFPPEGAITHLHASPRWVESGLRSYATHMPGE